MNSNSCWRFVAFVVVVSLSWACSSASSSSGGAGGGTAATEPSYLACTSGTVCTGTDTCNTMFVNGMCTRVCVSSADCGPGICLTDRTPHACAKRCKLTTECRADLKCDNAGGCNSAPMQAPECRSYVSCYERTGGTVGVLDNSYGPNGTCWSSGSGAVDACTSSCKSALMSLQSAYPDAGC